MRPTVTLLLALSATFVPSFALAQTGSASWYALDGNRTANGERMNSAAMTAAHRSLPFGTKIKVTNERNGKSVVVRINDRGPFAKNRVLDLSKGAARELGFVGRGHTTVTIAKMATDAAVGVAPTYAKLDEGAVTSPKTRPETELASLFTSGSVRGTPPPKAKRMDVRSEDPTEQPVQAFAAKAPAFTPVGFRVMRLKPGLFPAPALNNATFNKPAYRKTEPDA